MFYHGFENYLDHAYPEDELRPLTCGPLTRDNKNSEHNDVLGNYTLTLIDSLSTLAILSSSPDNGNRALKHFQNGVKDFVKLYGDGSRGPAGYGERSRGFDIDSKVQVFETVIRGLGISKAPCHLLLTLKFYHIGLAGLIIAQVDCSAHICSPSANCRSLGTTRQSRRQPLPWNGIRVHSQMMSMALCGTTISRTMDNYYD